MQTTATRADLIRMETSEILALYNQLTGKNTKKFASRARGVEQTLRALQERRPTNGSATATKPARKRPGMTFRAPPSKRGLRVPREGSKRAKVLQLLSRANGAKFTEIQETCGWEQKDAYEGIRLLNSYSGYGLWDERIMKGDEVVDYRVRVVTRQEYDQLTAEERA